MLKIVAIFARSFVPFGGKLLVFSAVKQQHERALRICSPPFPNLITNLQTDVTFNRYRVRFIGLRC